MSSPNDRLVSELEENFKKIIHSLRQVPSSRISSSAPLRTDSDQTGISRKIQDKPGAYSTLTRNVRFIADKIVEPFTKLQNLSSAHIIATQSHPHPIPAPVTAPSNPPLYKVSRPPPLRKPPFRPKTFLSSSARKITQIREDRKKGIITCYRCGEKNHSSRDCRNAIVCFECGRLGHRSRQCNTTKTLIPVKTHHPSKSTHSMAAKTYDAFSVLELKIE
jgi:Zinc knuckle